jgi:hypothetical protein
MSHAEEAQRLLDRLAKLDKGLDLQLIAQRAQAHALLALVEAVEGLQSPESDEPEVDPENTREGWSWP